MIEAPGRSLRLNGLLELFHQVAEAISLCETPLLEGVPPLKGLIFPLSAHNIAKRASWGVPQ